MEYFKSGLKSVLGSTQGPQPSGAETVEKLCDRAKTSTLIEDRRDAVRGLKALSKKFRVEVGAQALDLLTGVLENDRGDTEIVSLILDTLCNIMNNNLHQDDEEDSEETVVDEPQDIGIQFTEMFIKNQEHITSILTLLEEYDFHVRWPTVKLLTILLSNSASPIQQGVLVSPMGVSRLMDLLTDSREVIRNDALLLLTELIQGNTAIQKIVAFEYGFDRILTIISEEGYSDGGVVVEDCLRLLLSLLKHNTSNQNFFRESSLIQRLPPFLELQSPSDSSHGGWMAQKVCNIHLMLQVIRTLISPSNPQQTTIGCQKTVNTCGLLKQLCNILMTSGVPADILTETINTVAEVIRGNSANQEYFASVMAPSTPPRPAIVVLLMSMVNERQPFVLRCSVLYCFQCFLYKNELGQAQIISTLLPQKIDSDAATTITAGQLLCSGLFSSDPMSNWCAAIALSHALKENSIQKEQLLRVQLATSLGNPPVSLLQQCISILSQDSKLQTRVGLSILLSVWLTSSPVAVSHFLQNPSVVPFLISQVGENADEMEMIAQGLCALLLGICVHFNDDSVPAFTRESLRQIISKRIGMETFTDKLNAVSKSELYSKAGQKPHLKCTSPEQVLFDYEFTRLFKQIEVMVLKAVEEPDGSDGDPGQGDNHDTLILQYKEIIREQDIQLSQIQEQLKDMDNKCQSQRELLEQRDHDYHTLKDQYSTLKTMTTTEQTTDVIPASLSSSAGGDLTNHHPDIENQLRQFQSVISDKEHVIVGLEQTVSTLEANNVNKSDRIAELETILEDMQNIAQRYHEERRVGVELRDECSTLREQLTISQNQTEVSEAKNIDVTSELEPLKHEHDDLLVLLADQDGKIDIYKKRLRSLGQEVEEEDDLDNLEDDDEDDRQSGAEADRQTSDTEDNVAALEDINDFEENF